MSDNNRIDEILQDCIRLASGDFDIEYHVTSKNDNIDALGVGLTLLADHLKETTVSKEKLEIANEKLLKTDKKLNEAQKLAKIGNWEYNINTKEFNCSDEHLRIFEIRKTSTKDLVNKLRNKIHPEDLTSFENSFNTNLFKKNKIINEFRIICKNDKIKYVISIISTYKNTEDNSIIIRGTIQDITYRKIAEQKILEIEHLKSIHEKKLRDAIFLTKEREQKRIAQELHDDIGSSLTVIKFGIHQLNISDRKKSNLKSSLTFIIKKIRNLSNELSPSVLEEFGLINALKNLINNISESTSLLATFDSNIKELVGFSMETEISIYRIVQELLTNILKYANANNVNIGFHIEKDKMSLCIQDDGIGFIPEKNKYKNQSFGLMNIESRVEYLNATIEYRKNTPRGTIVNIEKYL